MNILTKLLPKRGPNEAALHQLAASHQQYNETVSRGANVSQLSAWLDKRTEANHFGDDLSITYVRRKHRHA